MSVIKLKIELISFPYIEEIQVSMKKLNVIQIHLLIDLKYFIFNMLTMYPKKFYDSKNKITLRK